MSSSGAWHVGFTKEFAASDRYEELVRKADRKVYGWASPPGLSGRVTLASGSSLQETG